jgi:hypothetical protein
LDDNLFSLGVDSLQAVRILARVRERYNVRVSLGDMFSHGTPLELADRVLEADVSDQQAVAPPSKRRSSWGPLALSQLPFYEMDRATQGAGLFNTVVDFHFRGDIDADVLREAVADVIRRQPVLRTVYRDDRSGPTQRVLDGLVVDELDLRGPDATHKFERFLLRQHRTGFDIETSPAARVTILRREDDAWSVVFTMHHIATDGWSGLVLTEDMADAYRRRMTEQDPAPVVRSYLDFARWQRDTLTGERLQSHLDYVAELLSEPSPRIGHQQPERPSYRTSVDRLELGASTMGAYTDLAQQTGTTRFATLAAAVTSFAQELTGSPRQLISIQSANRSWPGSEELVGCFSNVIHVGSPDAHLAPAELIGAVGESLAVAVSHDDVPLDYALGLLADKGIPAVEHLPGIAFASQPLLSVPVELPGCVMVATNTSQPSDGVDPTTYPLVVELADTGSGLIRRMRERWTDDAYDKARVSLVKTMTEFPATVGIRAE